MGQRFLSAISVGLIAAAVACGAEPPPSTETPATTLPPPKPAVTETEWKQPKPLTAEEAAKMPMVVPAEFDSSPTSDFEFDPSPFRELTFGVDYLLGLFPKGRSPSRSIIAVEPGQIAVSGRPLVVGSDENLDRRVWSGARMTLGYWWADPNPFDALMPIREFGVEARFFSLGERSLTAVNSTSPTIFRPFFDFNNRTDSAIVIAAPGLSSGAVIANASMSIWGAECNAWKRLYDNGTPTSFGVWLIGGYRYLDLEPELRIEQFTIFRNNLAGFPAFAAFAGNRIQGSESISARNQFHGGQLGINFKGIGSWCILDTTFKVALGATHEELIFQGSQVRTLANGVRTTSQGVLFALPSNIGRFSKDKFAQVPEVDVGIVVPVLPWLTLRSDFSALYWSRLVRAGTQINRTVDISQIPNFPQAATATPTGIGLPTVPFTQSDLWMLGISVGAELRW